MTPEELLGRLRFGGLTGRCLIDEGVLFIEADWFPLMRACVESGLAEVVDGGPWRPSVGPKQIRVCYPLKFAWRAPRFRTGRGDADFWFHVITEGHRFNQYVQANAFSEPEGFHEAGS